MTAKETKEKTLYFWRYLAAHPEIVWKTYFPPDMYVELCKYKNRCPLCAYSDCANCILDYCMDVSNPYRKWVEAITNKERQQAANELVARVEAWEVRE